jgi:hypothetical protein
VLANRTAIRGDSLLEDGFRRKNRISGGEALWALRKLPNQIRESTFRSTPSAFFLAKFFNISSVDEEIIYGVQIELYGVCDIVCKVE